MIRSYNLKPESIDKVYDSAQLTYDQRKKNFVAPFMQKVKLTQYSKNELEVDFIGVHTSLANAYRRIILSEIPIMAIKEVRVYNTSCLSDDILCHRIALIPLNCKPEDFDDWKEGQEFTPTNSVKFKLNAECTKKELGKNYCQIFSRDLKRVSFESEGKGVQYPAGVLFEDILLAKLAPKQEIELEAYAVKGIHRDHAKFQAGHCWYRLMNNIELNCDIRGEEALLLQECFSPGVIEINKKGAAKVVNARIDSCSRNYMRKDRKNKETGKTLPDFREKVAMSKVPDHIIFSVESQSILSSDEILVRSVEILIEKCDDLLTELSAYTDDSNVGS